MTIEEQLIGPILAIRWPGLDEPTRTAARTLLFDSLAVGVAGYSAAHAEQVRATARLWASGASGDAFVLGAGQANWTAPMAAFANAYQIHGQEFDCVHEPAVAHPMATVLSALLAEASRAPASGSDFLTAIVAGVEIVATLGVAARTGPRFFRPATAGVFGSVAALARLRRLSLPVATDALGHALSFASGTMQAHVEGKPTLALQVAHAARSAVEAVDLARAGIPAPAGAIGGPFGYLRLFEDEVDIDAALTRPGGTFRIGEVSIKPFPTGRAAHGGLVALREAMDRHGLRAEMLARFTYHAPPLIGRLIGRPAQTGMSVAYARLCLAWLGALQLTQSGVALEAFRPGALADPALLSLAQRFAVEDDGSTDPAAFGPAVADVELVDGTRYSVSVERQLGAPDCPLSEQQLIAKASECLAFGGLGVDLAARLYDAVATLDMADDAAAALRPLVTQAP